MSSENKNRYRFWACVFLLGGWAFESFRLRTFGDLYWLIIVIFEWIFLVSGLLFWLMWMNCVAEKRD